MFKKITIMNKKYFLMGVLAIALAVAGGYGVKASMNNDIQLSDLMKADVEAVAGNEWNHWTDWATHGFRKTEREERRPCPTSTSSTVSVGATYKGVHVGVNVTTTQKNPPERFEIICPSGNENCIKVPC